MKTRHALLVIAVLALASIVGVALAQEPPPPTYQAYLSVTIYLAPEKEAEFFALVTKAADLYAKEGLGLTVATTQSGKAQSEADAAKEAAKKPTQRSKWHINQASQVQFSGKIAVKDCSRIVEIAMPLMLFESGAIAPAPGQPNQYPKTTMGLSFAPDPSRQQVRLR